MGNLGFTTDLDKPQMPVSCFNETEGMSEQILQLRPLWERAGVALAPLKAGIVARLISIRAPRWAQAAR